MAAVAQKVEWQIPGMPLRWQPFCEDCPWWGGVRVLEADARQHATKHNEANHNMEGRVA